jgi:hypothetical protein
LLKTQKMTPVQLVQFAGEKTLFAVLDPCDAPLVPSKMHALSAQAMSLFRDMTEDDYGAVVPYLAHVDMDLLRWLRETLWNEPWGIFIVAKVELAELQAHLRKLLVVHAEGGRRLFFRYYDPRVISTYLPGCDATELRTFYGPATGLATANAEEVVYYSLE